MTSTDNNATPLLSVYMLTYNHEKIVAQAIESIISQETDFPFELVISDDCSSDATAGIVAGYAAKYPDIIKFKVNEKNLGLIPNYFATVERCRGKYVALCAGDDWWLPGKAALQVKYLEENPETGMVYTRVKRHFEDGKKRSQKKTEFGGLSTEYEELRIWNTIPAVTVMARRELVMRYVAEIDPLKRGWLTEDFPMWLWFAQESRIGFIDQITAVWRIWKGSLSHPVDPVSRLRFRESVTDAAYFLAKRYYGEDGIPDEVTIRYYYNLFDLHVAEKNPEALKKHEDSVRQLWRRTKMDKTAKMMLAVKYPHIYCSVRSFILNNRSLYAGV